MSLPVDNPTQSYWETPPHRLASYRSEFPKSVDVAIVGSGITGTNVARSLIEADSSLKIVIIEARTLCSGATGRNGGQYKPGSPHFHGSDYSVVHELDSAMSKNMVYEEAVAITRFENVQWSKLVTLAKKHNINCDMQELESVDAYYSKDGFEIGDSCYTCNVPTRSRVRLQNLLC